MEPSPTTDPAAQPTPAGILASVAPLSADLVAAETTPQALHSDASGKAEQKRWSRLGAWLAGLPTKQNIDLTGQFIDIVLRLIMSGAFLWMAWWWLEVVKAVLEKQQDATKPLSDPVLIALMGTTTLNVLGLLYFVANYLFPKWKGDKDSGIPTAPSSPVG